MKLAQDEFQFQVPGLMTGALILAGCKDLSGETIGILTQDILLEAGQEADIVQKIGTAVRKYTSTTSALNNNKGQQCLDDRCLRREVENWFYR